MIEVDHLTKRYGPATAVKDISFRVEKGEIVGFLGPNGAGKTTTMRILTCYMPATEGIVRIAGFDVFRHPLEVKRRIGYLPEHPPVYMDMKVRSYLEFVSKIKGVPKENRKVQVNEAMERCGIADRAGQLIGQLSKGYRQRVGIAQAILHNPEVIVLDEPTIGLDPNQIREIRHLIKSLGRDHTVILSTHILPEVEMACDRVIIINKGQIVAVDTPENLMAGKKGRDRVYLEVVGLAGPAIEAIREVPEVSDVQVAQDGASGRVGIYIEVFNKIDIRPKLADKIITHGLGLLEMRRMEISLEDIFHDLTTNEEVVP